MTAPPRRLRDPSQPCHSRNHYQGAARFCSELGIEPLDFASELWRVSHAVTAGLRAVMCAREAVARSISAEAAETRRRHRAAFSIAVPLWEAIEADRNGHPADKSEALVAGGCRS
jgi:hypothetical protein